MKSGVLSSITAIAVGYASAAADLPFTYTNSHGPFEMSWGFEGTSGSRDESIIIEFSLPSDIYIGIGLDCTSSAQCDMVVGNGGGRGGVYIDDYFEVHGDRKPLSDVELGGSKDVTLLNASYVDYVSTVRFSRKLNTGDKYDAVLTKGPTDIVYAWCEEPWCTDPDSPHAPGAWDIINVDLSGTRSISYDLHNDVCFAGSEALCSCSDLIKRGAIHSFDDCTQLAAIEYCEIYGACYKD